MSQSSKKRRSKASFTAGGSVDSDANQSCVLPTATETSNVRAFGQSSQSTSRKRKQCPLTKKESSDNANNGETTPRLNEFGLGSSQQQMESCFQPDLEIKLEMAALSINKTQEWHHFLNQSTRELLLNVMVEDIKGTLGYNGQRALDWAKQLERDNAIQADSFNTYFWLCFKELQGLQKIRYEGVKGQETIPLQPGPSPSDVIPPCRQLPEPQLPYGIATPSSTNPPPQHPQLGPPPQKISHVAQSSGVVKMCWPTPTIPIPVSSSNNRVQSWLSTCPAPPQLAPPDYSNIDVGKPTSSNFPEATPLAVIISNQVQLGAFPRHFLINQMVRELGMEGSVWFKNRGQVVQFAQQIEWYAATLTNSWTAYANIMYEPGSCRRRNYSQTYLQTYRTSQVVERSNGTSKSTATLPAEVSSPPPILPLQSAPASTFVFAPSTSTGRSWFRLTLLRAMNPVWTLIDKKPIPKSVSQPLDYTSIKRRLEFGMYTDPWGFIDDLCSAFDKAKMLCEKGPTAHTYWNEICELLNKKFNEVMRERLGYCCGNNYKFQSKTYRCSGKGCTIQVGDPYYCYENSAPYCIQCFQTAPDMINVDQDMEVDDDIAVSVAPKARFSQWKNNISEAEPFVTCVPCGRRNHCICVGYLDTLAPNGFVCKECLLVGKTSLTRASRARDLPISRLSTWIEDHISAFLKRENLPLNVRVRVVASAKKEVEVQHELMTAAKMPPSFPYTIKSVVAFLEGEDESDVCFFAFYVHEFGPNCPGANRGRVYISYLDSVRYFQPATHRSYVYKEILLGYLGYAKQQGYTTAHIWACPPPIGCSDYIFYAHPPEQIMPTSCQLQTWYQSLAKLGEKHGFISGIKTIVEYANETGMNGVDQLPYFHGDYWPEVLEKLMQKLHRGKGAFKSSMITRGKEAREILFQNILWGKVKEEMNNSNNTFYVLLLQPQSNLGPPLLPDPDRLIPCELLEDRNKLIDSCQLHKWEFSSLRRAKYSTKAIIHQILN